MITQNKLFLVRAEDGVGAGGAQLVDDPLAMPASEVDTRFPRLQPDRVYRMSIAEASKSKVKDSEREMIVLKLVTTKEEIDTDGKTLHPGFSVFHRIGVTVTKEDKALDLKERTGKDIARDVAIVLKAIGKGTTAPITAINETETVFKDQIVDVKIGMNKAKDGYPESNKVSQFIIPS